MVSWQMNISRCAAIYVRPQKPWNMLIWSQYFGEALRKGLNPVDMGYGDRLSGSARLKNAIADMFNESVGYDRLRGSFSNADSNSTGTSTRSSQLCPSTSSQVSKGSKHSSWFFFLGTGCTTVLDQLSWTILNPGDAILIAAPLCVWYIWNIDPSLTVQSAMPGSTSTWYPDLDPMSFLSTFQMERKRSHQNLWRRLKILCKPARTKAGRSRRWWGVHGSVCIRTLTCFASCYAILKIHWGGHIPVKQFLRTRCSQRSTTSTLSVMKFMRWAFTITQVNWMNSPQFTVWSRAV